ncbi:hypothetical protein DFH06DRAFT_1189982 [Mycena polygramma]|nr:hypothetical protein DFH06DRAFT_1189982 [Mycena polygramma]
MTTDIDLTNPPPDYDSHNVDEDKGSTNSPAGPYIYYRVYSMDGAIPSKTASDSASPFIGRILARSIPPPRKVEQLKRCVAKAESISDPQGLRTILYQDQAARYAMNLGAKLTTNDGPGATPATALALLVADDLTLEENAAVNAIDVTQNCERSEYLYYQLYTWTGEDSSNTGFDSTEPSVGRLERFRIPPPLGPSSIKRTIAKAEEKRIYAYAALYEDVSADLTMVDGSVYPSISDGTAGSAKERPMVLVQPERRQGLYNRPFKRIAITDGSHVPKIGETGHTDGFYTAHGYHCEMLYGRNVRAQFVPPADVKFLDE